MPEEKPLASLDDAALFSGAVAPEPEPSPAPSEQAGEPPSPAPIATPLGEGGEPAKPVDETIPSWRLREESEHRRAAEKRAAELEVLLTNLTEAVQAEQAKAGQKQAPDFYEDPRAAVSAIVAQAVQPFAEQTHRTLMALGRLTAVQAHTEKGVIEAEQAFLKGIDDKTLDVMDYERVVQSPNRYDAVVQWHKRQRTLQEVGEDPAAYFNRMLDTQLSDPGFQGKLLEKLRAAASGQGSPSVVQLPPSLSKVTSSAPPNVREMGDLSDASLYSFATGAKK